MALKPQQKTMLKKELKQVLDQLAVLQARAGVASALQMYDIEQNTKEGFGPLIQKANRIHRELQQG